MEKKWYPLTKNQIILYNFQKHYPKDSSYNVSVFTKITGKLDIYRLKKILEIAYDSVDVFKINFVEGKNSLFQSCIKGGEYKVDIITNTANESITSFRYRVFKQVKHLENVPINLGKWPLFNILLWNYNDKEYYSLIIMPHIITDGYSYYMLIDVVNKCYNSAFSFDKIKEIMKKYFSAGFLQEEYLPKNDADSTNFFLNELRDLTSTETKTIKQYRNKDLLLEGKSINVKVNKNRVMNYTKKYKIRETSFFLGVYSVFLKKVINENVFVIGLPVLNRSGNGKNIFGYFVNTLPLVINFNNVKTFQELISIINKKIYSLLRYQSFELDGIGNNIEIKYNNYFTYYKKEFNFNFSKCKCKRIIFPRKNIMSELRCTVSDLADTYKLSMEYGDFLKNVNVEQILQNIIYEITATDNCTIGGINIYNKKTNEIYNTVNSYKKYQQNTSIKSMFEKIANKYPNNIALYDFYSKWTYAELNKTANQISKYLTDKTRGKKKIIISVKRNNYLVAIILAVLKIGKCYVPVDLNCPPNRFKYILNNLDTTAVIGEREVKDNYNLDSENFILVDDLIAQSKLYDCNNVDLPVHKEEMAYIIYTSGSTGNPKGVEISNNNLLSLLDACKNKFDFNDKDIWTLFHSYGFDFSVWEIFGCLLSGGQLIVIDTLTTKSPKDFYDILAKYKVTILNQTPTAFKGVIQEDSLYKKSLNLRYIIFGGEVLNFPTLKRWVSNHALRKTKIINMYGITETTIHVTFYEMSRKDLNNNHSIIGKPLSNLSIFIINNDGNILPEGLQGEIIVSGDGVFHGYYNNQKFTTEKLVRINDGSLTYYKTGDLGKINKNGDIEYLGRLDRQIQLRGFRIELGEIENCIMRSNLVQDCAVDFVNCGEDNNNKIVAYFIPYRGCDEHILKKELSLSLPLYMIPSLFVSVEKIPMTINGKIDFNLLRNNIKKNKIISKGTTYVEITLFDIVANRINNDSFSLSDNLLDIGVSSIDLVKIFYKINEQFPMKKFSMLDMFQYTSIEKLASHINHKINQNNC